MRPVYDGQHLATPHGVESLIDPDGVSVYLCVTIGGWASFPGASADSHGVVDGGRLPQAGVRREFGFSSTSRALAFLRRGPVALVFA